MLELCADPLRIQRIGWFDSGNSILSTHALTELGHDLVQFLNQKMTRDSSLLDLFRSCELSVMSLVFIEEVLERGLKGHVREVHRRQPFRRQPFPNALLLTTS